MRDVDISNDPADYLYGPTSAQAARGSGGTNRDGGVSIVDEEETPTVTTAQPEQGQQQTPPAAQ